MQLLARTGSWRDSTEIGGGQRANCIMPRLVIRLRGTEQLPLNSRTQRELSTCRGSVTIFIQISPSTYVTPARLGYERQPK